MLLFLAAAILAGIARRVGAPYPVFLALGGAALAFIPGRPTLNIPPDVVLALFVAPVLLDTAYDTSLRDLRDNVGPVAGLVLGAVGLTTVAVAVVVHAMVPDAPWAVAVVLGAIVAPPDAVAATAVLRSLKPPQRLLTILEGESLLNDASALLVYRVAVGAVVAQEFSIAAAAPAFLLGVAGSVIVGPILGWLVFQLLNRVQHVPTAIILQFITTFAVWLFAEHFGLSGVLTTVCYAVTLARHAPSRVPARMRIPSAAVWDTAVFALSILAFIFIGLQLRPIVEVLEPDVRYTYFVTAGAVLATVIAARFAWHMPFNAWVRWCDDRQGFHPPRPMLEASARSGLLISWAGMRGIVSLAAAMALPGDFPYRDLILLIAFAVVVGTLVIQGLTLKPLMLALHLNDGDPVGSEIDDARRAALRAALDSFAEEQSPIVKSLRRELELRLGDANQDRAAEAGQTRHGALRRSALAAARNAVLEMRSSEAIGDDAFHRVEEELDWLEMADEAADEADRSRDRT